MTNYWLDYIMGCTDNAVMPQDVGANPDAIPPSTAKMLVGWRFVKRLKNKRLAITSAGRKKLKGEI